NLTKPKAQTSSQTYLLIVLVLAPYLVTPIEKQIGVQESIRTVPTQITIHASEEAIWQNIIRVPKIANHEQHLSIYHAMGVPRPVEATLSKEGVGGVRHATFDDGLAFIETVTAWEDHRTISFTIKVDASSVLNPPFDAVGGKYFDVLAGTYTMEPLGN